jgi:hypothetical protein
MTVSAKALMDALRVLAAADPADVAQARIDRDLLSKAEPAVRAVDDHLRTDRNRAPTREEAGIGRRPFPASGAGTRPMAEEFDDLATQLQSVNGASRLGELLEGFDGRLGSVEKALQRLDGNARSQLGLIGKLAAGIDPALSKAIAALLKADKNGEGEAEEEEEEETEEERAKKAAAEKAAALRGETIAIGSVHDVLAALQGGAPIAKAVPAIQSALDDDGIDLTERLRLASAATRAMVGQA